MTKYKFQKKDNPSKTVEIPANSKQEAWDELDEVVDSDFYQLVVLEDRYNERNMELEIERDLMDTYLLLGIDKPSNHDNIVQFIKNDIEESADAKLWHTGDIAIAFRRFLEVKTEGL